MKRLFARLIAAFAAVAAFGFAVTCFAEVRASDRDWKGDMARAANDLPAFLHYQPTDGASHAGKVRKSMDPSHVQP